jgi:hypothetical protein
VAADAEVDPFTDRPFRPPEIMASVDVAPFRGRRSWALDEASATDVSAAAPLPYAFLKGAVQAATDVAAAAPHPMAAATTLALRRQFRRRLRWRLRRRLQNRFRQRPRLRPW